MGLQDKAQSSSKGYHLTLMDRYDMHHDILISASTGCDSTGWHWVKYIYLLSIKRKKMTC